MELNMTKFTAANRRMFEDVANSYQNIKDSDNVQYTILNYGKILDEMCEFIEGYISYRDKGDNTYAGKVLSTTIYFYNAMFNDTDKYRRRMTLAEMKGINKEFLEQTKRLQSLLEKYSKDKSDDKELSQLLNLTNNQYAKISKVYKDDMKIYLWLTSLNSRFLRKSIDVDLRIAFEDKSTPVMHVYKPN